jgi:hypothetical protein
MSFTTAEEIRIQTIEDFMAATKALLEQKIDFDLRQYYRKKLEEAEAE